MLTNELTTLLKIKRPIIQAPMAGGITGAKLVAAVSNNGGLGMIGAGYLSADQLRESIQETRKLTENPFGVNLFVPENFLIDEAEVAQAKDDLQQFSKRLHIDGENNVALQSAADFSANFMEQIEVIIAENVPVCSFTFGIPEKAVIEKLQKEKILTMGTATTVNEAIANEKAGIEVVVAQGSEAGGHRGSFLREEKAGLIGLMSLLPQMVDHVSVPIVAAGGIMDGRGIVAASYLGAKAVQMGTAFLTTAESSAHEAHKERIVQSSEDEIVLTRAFSGKFARGINNEFIKKMNNSEQNCAMYPVQNTLTQAIRKAAQQQNNPEFMSLWSGQSPRLARQEQVASLMKRLDDEVEQLIKQNPFY